MLDNQIDAQRVLAALRAGAGDIFTPPYDRHQILTTIRRAVQAKRDRDRRELRTTRLRRLSSRLIRDRRELRQRVDLICRDLVQAYRRLVSKVVDSQDPEFIDGLPPRVDSFDPGA